MRSIEEIRNDIDAMRRIVSEIVQVSINMGCKGSINKEVLLNAAERNPAIQDDYFRLGMWLYDGAKTVFLQDANSLVMKTSILVDIIRYLKEKFPTIERITSYARSKTISRKTPEEMKDLREAGLTRIHIGMESGSDKVLDLIRKGVSSAEHISAGQKAIGAGFDLSEYYMPGLGGKELSLDHSIQSARVLSAINPTFIRIRTTIVVPGTPLYDLYSEKKWAPLTEEEKLNEIRIFIENLDCRGSFIVSDHMMNLLEDLGGSLPGDRGRMLQLIDSFFNMKKEDRDNFIIGRRLGYFRFLSDYRRDEKIDLLRQEIITNYATIDDAIMEILRNYI